MLTQNILFNLCHQFSKDLFLPILIDSLGQHTSSAEYRTILEYRLIIP